MSTREGQQERVDTSKVSQADSQSTEGYPKVGVVTTNKDGKDSKRWGRRFNAKDLINKLLS